LKLVLLARLFDPAAIALALLGALASFLLAGGARHFGIFGRALGPKRVISGKDLEAPVADAFRMRPEDARALISKVSDPFMQRAVAGSLELDPDELGRTLELEMEAQRAVFEEGQQALERAADAADAWGAIGALAGFAAALALREDEAARILFLGFSLRSALWGLLLSRIVLWPMASRLRAADSARLVAMRLAREAVASGGGLRLKRIAEGLK
jgi:flagellar motor component MotA